MKKYICRKKRFYIYLFIDLFIRRKVTIKTQRRVLFNKKNWRSEPWSPFFKKPILNHYCYDYFIIHLLFSTFIDFISPDIKFLIILRIINHWSCLATNYVPPIIDNSKNNWTILVIIIWSFYQFSERAREREREKENEAEGCSVGWISDVTSIHIKPGLSTSCDTFFSLSRVSFGESLVRDKWGDFRCGIIEIIVTCCVYVYTFEINIVIFLSTS